MGNDTEPRALGDVLAERVKRYRELAGLRQDDLAERTAQLGYPLNRVSVAKIEAGTTRAHNVTLTDVLVLALALDVPPVLLFLPLGDDEQVAVTPGNAVHPHLALEWLCGDETFTRDGASFAWDRSRWTRNAQPVYLFRRLRELQEACHRRGATDEDFRRLAEHLEYMERAGLAVPDMPDEWQDRLDEGARRGQR